MKLNKGTLVLPLRPDSSRFNCCNKWMAVSLSRKSYLEMFVQNVLGNRENHMSSIYMYMLNT